MEDIVSLAKNKSFVFSTLAFTCVTFCTGALSWWGPVYIQNGLKTMKEEDRAVDVNDVPFVFGVVTMMSGIVGVPLGMILSTKLKAKYPRADPVICAVSILVDMLLYIVSPTCRSTAEAIQILASHAFGDAGSPYLIGLVSDGLLDFLKASSTVCAVSVATEAATSLATTDPTMQLTETTFDTLTTGDVFEDCEEVDELRYYSLQYSLFTNCGVEVVGGVLFLITAIYIVRDKLACENSAAATKHKDDPCGARLMMTPTNYSPEDSLGDEMPSDDEEMPKLKLLDGSEISSSRSPTPV